MTPTEYDDTMVRARATLAALRRAAADLSKPGQDAEGAAGVLHDLTRHHSPSDAPSDAQPARR